MICYQNINNASEHLHSDIVLSLRLQSVRRPEISCHPIKTNHRGSIVYIQNAWKVWNSGLTLSLKAEIVVVLSMKLVPEIVTIQMR